MTMMERNIRENRKYGRNKTKQTMKPKTSSLRKINKINKPVTRLIRK